MVVDASATIAMIVLPLGVSVALVSEELVLLTLGAKWELVTPIVQVLVPVFALRSLAAVTDPVVMATGDTKPLFYRACLMFGIRFGLFVPGLIYFGLMGAVYGWALSNIIYVLIQLVLLGRVMETPFYVPVVRAWRTWVSLVCMVIAVRSLNVAYEPLEGGWPLIMSLLTKLGAGGATFCLVHISLWALCGRPGGAEARIADFTRNLFRQRNG